MEPHEDRCNWAVMLNGEVASAVVINAFHTEKQPSFGLVLVYFDRPVWRIDYRLEQTHTNSFLRGNGLPALVFGPHYHSWEDNEHLATTIGGIPDKLKIAAPLPSNVRGYENCFRWFCDCVKIDISGQDIPPLPIRKNLL